MPTGVATPTSLDSTDAAAASGPDYATVGGFPAGDTVQRAYDDVDLVRATQMYRVFYPSVSGAAIFAGSAKVGVRPNEVFGYMDTKPRHVGYTLNSDTPYGAVLLDLRAGPLVLELLGLGTGIDVALGRGGELAVYFQAGSAWR